MHTIPVTPVIRGHLDRFRVNTNGMAEIRGWIFREDRPLDKIDIALKNQPWVSSLSLYERPDLKIAFESVINRCPHITRSGFDITAPLPAGVEAGPSTIV